MKGHEGKGGVKKALNLLLEGMRSQLNLAELCQQFLCIGVTSSIRWGLSASCGCGKHVTLSLRLSVLFCEMGTSQLIVT